MDFVAQADFSKTIGRIRPELHSSGWAPRSSDRAIQNDDEAVKALNMTYARTHDWALVNPGQRIIDTHFIFPLADKDPKDPSNYVFAPTDHIIGLARDIGLKIFYRLGTSIEHTGKIHFNALVPDDFEKTAEVFAGIVRHYNKGWANGKKWGIKYWEIWNEPDGTGNMWCSPDDDFTGESWWRMLDRFIEFFVICLKRLKSEFPDIKVGGPALCCLRQDFFTKLLKACKEAGVAPDFISWHGYASDPWHLLVSADQGRALCDSLGFRKCELILNEWHYILTWDGIHGQNSTPAMVHRAFDGPTGHNQIDSAAFTLTCLAKFQTSKFDQAYYYGCSHQGNWGYMDIYKQYNKNWYACKLFGGIVKGYRTMCESASEAKTITTLAVKSADGKKAGLLVVDYRGTGQVLQIAVKGVPKTRRASAIVLDHTRDNFPCEVGWRDGILTLVKPDKNSAAFFVEFE